MSEPAPELHSRVFLLPRISHDHKHRQGERKQRCPRCSGRFTSKYVFFRFWVDERGIKRLHKGPVAVQGYHFAASGSLAGDKKVCRGRVIIQDGTDEYLVYAALIKETLDGFGGTIMPCGVHNTIGDIIDLVGFAEGTEDVNKTD